MHYSWGNFPMWKGEEASLFPHSLAYYSQLKSKNGPLLTDWQKARDFREEESVLGGAHADACLRPPVIITVRSQRKAEAKRHTHPLPSGWSPLHDFDASLIPHVKPTAAIQWQRPLQFPCSIHHRNTLCPTRFNSISACNFQNLNSPEQNFARCNPNAKLITC